MVKRKLLESKVAACPSNQVGPNCGRGDAVQRRPRVQVWDDDDLFQRGNSLCDASYLIPTVDRLAVVGVSIHCEQDFGFNLAEAVE